MGSNSRKSRRLSDGFKRIGAMVLAVILVFAVFTITAPVETEAAAAQDPLSGNSTARTKRWKIIPTGKGTYYIQSQYSNLYWSLADVNKKKENDIKLVQKKDPFE